MPRPTEAIVEVASQTNGANGAVNKLRPTAPISTQGWGLNGIGYQQINYSFKNLADYVTFHEEEFVAVRQEYVDADLVITTAYEAADLVLTNGLAQEVLDRTSGDSSIRTDYALADTQIRQDFVAADTAHTSNANPHPQYASIDALPVSWYGQTLTASLPSQSPRTPHREVVRTLSIVATGSALRYASVQVGFSHETFVNWGGANENAVEKLQYRVDGGAYIDVPSAATDRISSGGSSHHIGDLGAFVVNLGAGTGAVIEISVLRESDQVLTAKTFPSYYLALEVATNTNKISVS